MFGNATLSIPGNGVIEPTCTDGLSDDLAMAIGRLAARILSEHDGPVIVSLEDGRVIRLEYGYNNPSEVHIDMEVIRHCGGFREYAAIIGRPII